MTAGPGLKTGLLLWWFIGRREQSDDRLDACPAVPLSALALPCHATDDANATVFCRICPR